MASPASKISSGYVLNSWKEIASHVGRGVRTVQRWERDLGMPVRRPRSKSRSAVLAMSDEIDAWLRSAPTAQSVVPRLTSDTIDCLHQSILTRADLRQRCVELRAANSEALTTLVSNIQRLRDLATRSREIRSTPPPDLFLVTTKLSDSD